MANGGRCMKSIWRWTRRPGLETNLKKMGYQTVMTRRSDYFITLPQRVSHRQPLQERDLRLHPFQLHVEATGQRLETFYYSSEGQRLAQCVQSSLVRRTRTVDRNAKFARYYVLRNSTLPAILVEGGFVTNESRTEPDEIGRVPRSDRPWRRRRHPALPPQLLAAAIFRAASSRKQG